MKSVTERAKAIVYKKYMETDPSLFTSSKAIMDFAESCVRAALEDEPKSSPKDLKSTFEERLSKFNEECMKYANEFGRQMVDKFFLYWSEPNKSGTKMRWEQQPTWEIHRRMLNWASRNNNGAQAVSFPTERKKSKSVVDIMRAHYGKDAEIF